MRNIILILCTLFAGNVLGLTIDTIPSKSEIIGVTVFFSGAQITRDIEINLPKGKHTILIGNLTREISPQSIQVKGLGNCTILSVKHQLNYQSEKDTLETVLEEAIKLQEFEMKAIKNKLNVFDLEEKLLLDNSFLGRRDDGTTINEIKEAADYYRLRLNEIRAGKLQLSLELDDAGKRMQELYVEMNKVTAKTRKTYGEVFVTLDCGLDIQGLLKLKYYIPSAGWEPNYDFRVEDITVPLTIVYNADVYQSSGEDWNNVDIRLSTNNPSLSGEKPELSTWYLDRKKTYKKETIQTGAGALKGRILDMETKEPIPFANIALFQGDELITGATSDFDGAYTIKPVQSGQYRIRASFIGYTTIELVKIPVEPDQITFQDFELPMTHETLEAVEIVEYKVPLISKYNTTSGATFSDEEILRMPNRSSSSVATSVGGVYAGGKDDNLLRGNRSEESIFYVEGEDSRSQVETVNYISNSLNTRVTNLEYDIEVPYSIPSDGKDYNLKIKEVSLPVNYIYYAVPKLDNDAFLNAEIIDWTELNLLSGKVGIYFKGTYTGESFINTNRTDDTLSVSLGRDKNIVVNREGNKEMFDKRIIGNNIKEVVGWDITVKNNKATNIKIVVEDQFPISEKKSIEVERLESSGAEIEDNTGKLKWEFSLGPNERKVINYQYSVKYPKYLNLYLE